MKHLKHFNESTNDEIKSEIKQVVEQFVEGYYVPGYNFMSERFLKELIKKYPDETTKFQGKNEKCIKVDFHNEGIGRVEDARLNIYLDENSQTLFDESIHNLKAELKMITNSFRLEDVPEKLSPFSELTSLLFMNNY